MDFQLPIQIKHLHNPIEYGHKILLTGSCFTEHIGTRLQTLKFDTLQNPNGILFDPRSVTASLVSYTEPNPPGEESLFFLDELWHSWQHHSIFSSLNRQDCLDKIYRAHGEANRFLKEANWLVVTLGSAFCYRLSPQVPAEQNGQNTVDVANCHRAPASWFIKHLMTIDEILSCFDACLYRLNLFNPDLRILFTVSPVRHVRDGVVENNRSKARLIEAVHHLVQKYPGTAYFPAYELVIDILRDYRFYDVDMVHPNYQATEFVMQSFVENCLSANAQLLAEEIHRIVMARKHKPFHPESAAHRRFLETYHEKARSLQTQYPFLDLKEEITYFSEPVS